MVFEEIDSYGIVKIKLQIYDSSIQPISSQITVNEGSVVDSDCIAVVLDNGILTFLASTIFDGDSYGIFGMLYDHTPKKILSRV